MNNKDVYRVDTRSKKRTHIAELPFPPRCTATGHGYFCAGGDNHGYFASLRIPEQSYPSRADLTGGAIPDSSVDHVQQTMPPFLEHLSFVNRSVPRVERLGEDIVNSISIHALATDDTGVRDDIVAILTNNDKTVRMYSLTRDTELKVEDFPFQMNHATISPDGRLLVIVGDQELIYFYRRIEVPSSPEKVSPHRRVGLFEWERLRVFRLHKPNAKDYSAYFTTAWSPSGKLCATASEDGYITVYDVDAIADAELESDPVVAVAPSSRRETASGAIRTMLFAPEPWDYLIWAEENGRVCIGDLRTGLNTRQVVNLDPKGEHVTRIDLMDSSSTLDDFEHRDYDSDLDFIRRYQRALGTGDNRDAVSFATDYINSSAERRRQIFPAGLDMDDDPHGLNEEERQILEGLRSTRQRTEDLQRRTSQLMSSRPQSISYGSASSRSGHHTPVPPVSGNELSRLRQDAAALGSLRDYMRDTNALRRNDRPSTSQLAPRRRNSIMLSSSTDPSSARPSNPAPTDPDPWRFPYTAPSRNSLSSYANIVRDPSNASPSADNAAIRRSSYEPSDPYPELPPIMIPQESGTSTSSSISRDAHTPNTEASAAASRNVSFPHTTRFGSGNTGYGSTGAGSQTIGSILNTGGGGSTGAANAAADARARVDATTRDVERLWRRDPGGILAHPESNLLRRVGIGLRDSNTRLRGGPPADWTSRSVVEDLDEVGTAGLAIAEGGRTL